MCMGVVQEHWYKLLFIKSALQKLDFLQHGICFSLQRTKSILESRDAHLFQGAALSREASVCELILVGWSRFDLGWSISKEGFVLYHLNNIRLYETVLNEWSLFYCTCVFLGVGRGQVWTGASTKDTGREQQKNTRSSKKIGQCKKYCKLFTIFHACLYLNVEFIFELRCVVKVNCDF